MEREGIERERARAIALAEAAGLRELELPTPRSGLFSTALPKGRFNSPFGLPGLRVRAPAERSYFLRLSEWYTGAPAMALFVRAGETVDVEVPLGHVPRTHGIWHNVVRREDSLWSRYCIRPD